MNIAHDIGVYKQKENLAIYQPERWENTLNLALERGHQLGLSKAFIMELFQSLHAESIEHQFIKKQIMSTKTSRTVTAPKGTKLHCKGWAQEAAWRMIQHNLDPEVAERPEELIVYGGRGKAARNWEAFDLILKTLENLEDDETLLVQSGKPVGVIRSHKDAPRVLIANSNLVRNWANWNFELERKRSNDVCQMTAGSWIYIATQGIVPEHV